jgi:hypothetical protein
MRIGRLAAGAMPACLLLLSFGCGPSLHDNKTVKVEQNSVGSARLEIPAGKSERKVTVKVNSPDTPVSAYLVLSDDVEKATKALHVKNEKPDGALAGQEEPSSDFTLEATVGANKESTVLFVGGKKTADVKVEIIGK